jgi:hypothetical protein
MSFTRKLAALAAAMLLASGMGASAAVLNVTPTTCLPNPNGSTSTCTVSAGGATATVKGLNGAGGAAKLITQNYATTGVKATGIGVGTGGSGTASAEVQATLAEKIQIDYATSVGPVLQSFNQIVIAHLYNPDTFGAGGDPKEVARITATNTATGASQVVSLQSLGDAANQFTLSGTGVGGTGSAVRTGTDGTPLTGVRQGRFELTGLFGGFLFDQLSFMAICVDRPAGNEVASCSGDNSDFSISAVATTVVPLPAAGLLLFGALGGLGLMSRRRKAA